MPGTALVVRAGDVVLTAAVPPGPLSERVVDAVRRAATGSGGADVVAHLGPVLVAHAADVPWLAALGPVPSGLAVLVHGGAAVEIEQAGETRRLEGAGTAWHAQVVAGIAERVAAGPASRMPGRSAPFDLVEGAVPGDGVVLEPASPPPGPPPDGTAAPGRDAAPVPVASGPDPSALPVGAGTDRDAVRRASPLFDPDFAHALPLPVAAHRTPTPSGRPLVRGILCPVGHFNHPLALFCGACGRSMQQRTHQLVEGERPPLGVLVFADGSTYALDEPYVVGRSPERDAAVAEGAARPLRLRSDTNTVSRVHAAIDYEEWDVRIRDRGSHNGTYLLVAGTTQWRRVGDQPHVLAAGDRVAVGEHQFVFEPHVVVP